MTRPRLSLGCAASLLLTLGLGLSIPAYAAVNLPAKQGELVELEVKDVVPIGQGDQSHAVMLVSTDGTVLPLFVTEESAVSIAFRLAHKNPPHPLAADLTDSVLSQLGGQVQEVRIEAIRDHIFYGHVVLKQGGRKITLEARPSDAIALALTGNAKIFATRRVLDEGGITQQEIEKERQKEKQSGAEHRDALPPPLPDQGNGVTL